MYIPQELRDKVIRKFTNRFDGCVLPNISVKAILDYLGNEKEPVLPNNILSKFKEEEINHMDH